jgi:hypothetical protein
VQVHYQRYQRVESIRPVPLPTCHNHRQSFDSLGRKQYHDEAPGDHHHPNLRRQEVGRAKDEFGPFDDDVSNSARILDVEYLGPSAVTFVP